MALIDNLRSATKQPVILLNWQIGKELSKLSPRNSDSFAWSIAPVINGVTYSNTRYAAIDTRLFNIRRDVVRFTVAGTVYTKVNSVPLVDATAGTWFFDAAASVIYFRPAATVGLDSVFWFDNGTGNYGDETEDARSATTADVTIKANVSDLMYFGMASSKFEYLKLVFSTAPVKALTSTRTYEYWNGAWAALSVTAFTGDANWDNDSTVELRWPAPADWATTTTVGNATVGTPSRYWIRSKVNTANYTTAGVGSQFMTALVPNENIAVAWCELTLGNKTVYINGKHYQSRLIASADTTASTISSSQPDAAAEAMIGSTINSTGGSIMISNGDGAFDSVCADWVIHGGAVSLYIGFDTPSYTMPFADYVQFRGSTLEGFVRRNDTLELKMMNQTMKMDVPLLQSFFSSADYSTMDRSKDGTAIPIYLGNTETLAPSPDSPQDKWNRFVPGVKIKQGTTGAGGGFVNQRWKFATVLTNPETGAVHIFGAGDGVKNIGPSSVWHMKTDKKVPTKPVATGNYDVLEFGTVVAFKAGYEVADGDEIRIQTQGYLDDASGTFTGSAGSVISKPSDVAHFLFVCLCKYSTADLNIATFTATGVTKQGIAGTLTVPTAYTDNVSIYVADPAETGRTVINRITNGIRGTCQPDNSGTLSMAVLSTAPVNTDAVLFRHLMADFSESWLTDQMASRLLLKFRQYPTGTWSTSIGSQLTTVGATSVIDIPAAAFMNFSKDITIETYMYTQAKADALSKILYDYFKRGRIVYHLIDSAGLGLDKLLGDRLLLTLTRMIGGSKTEKKTWLLSLNKQWGGATVEVEAIEAA